MPVGAFEMRKTAMRSETCRRDFERMQRRFPELLGVYLVNASGVDEDWRGRGIGSALYRRGLMDAAAERRALVPDQCAGGDDEGTRTSALARRHWDALKREYPHEGSVVYGATFVADAPGDALTGDAPTTDVDEYLAAYLVDRGEAPGIGPERGTRPQGSGVARYNSPHGSVRYVMYRDDVPVAALQLVRVSPVHAIAANVYTAPAWRRQGLARQLLERARRDLGTVEQSKHQSAAGRAWSKAVR